MKWQRRRRRSEHGAPAIPDDDHAADSPQYRPDDPYADGAGHRYPGLRSVPARLRRLNFPSRLRIDVSPGLQRCQRRRRDGEAAGRRGAGASVRGRRDSIAARLQMKARGARWRLYRAVSALRRDVRYVARPVRGGWLKDAEVRRRGVDRRWCAARPAGGAFEQSRDSRVCLLLYKKCDELPSNVLRSMSENSFLCSLRLLMLNNIVMIK